MAPRKGSSPFSRVKSPQLLDPRKTWYLPSNRVCGKRPPKHFSRNKLPPCFPEDIVRIKWSAIQTVDWGLFQGKASPEDEIVASLFESIAIFLLHAPDLQLFKEVIIELRRFLNIQAIGTTTEVAMNPSNPLKTQANRCLPMPLSTDVTDCFSLTSPSSFSKKVSLWFPFAKLKKKLKTYSWSSLPEKKSLTMW